jgi:antitoxin (DNA-binding transcriptional repressor) of toxin-antitoxin stability system
MSMDETVDTVPAGAGAPVACLVPLESPGDREERIIQDLRSGSVGTPVDEQTLLAPTPEIAGWSDS